MDERARKGCGTRRKAKREECSLKDVYQAIEKQLRVERDANLGAGASSAKSRWHRSIKYCYTAEQRGSRSSVTRSRRLLPRTC